MKQSQAISNSVLKTNEKGLNFAQSNTASKKC